MVADVAGVQIRKVSSPLSGDQIGPLRSTVNGPLNKTLKLHCTATGGSVCNGQIDKFSTNSSKIG